MIPKPHMDHKGQEWAEQLLAVLDWRDVPWLPDHSHTRWLLYLPPSSQGYFQLQGGSSGTQGVCGGAAEIS